MASSRNTYPAGHPYSWSVIGSMEDLDAASARRRSRVVQGATTAPPTRCFRSRAISRRIRKGPGRKSNYFGDTFPPARRIATHTKRGSPSARGAHRHGQATTASPRLASSRPGTSPQMGLCARAIYLSIAASILLASGQDLAAATSVWSMKIRSRPAARAFGLACARSPVSVRRSRRRPRPGQDLGPKSRRRSMRSSRGLLAEGPTARRSSRRVQGHNSRAGASFAGIERIGGFGGQVRRAGA